MAVISRAHLPGTIFNSYSLNVLIGQPLLPYNQFITHFSPTETYFSLVSDENILSIICILLRNYQLYMERERWCNMAVCRVLA